MINTITIDTETLDVLPSAAPLYSQECVSALLAAAPEGGNG